MNATDREIEAGGIAAYDTACDLMRFPSDWDGAPEGIKRTYRNMAAATLAAVEPLLRERIAQEIEAAASKHHGGQLRPHGFATDCQRCQSEADAHIVRESTR